VVTPGQLTLGRNVFIGPNSNISAVGGLVIEDDVLIGPGLTISGGNHRRTADRRFATARSEDNPPLRIGEGAWIGANVTILAGASIGRYSVIGAGSVVTRPIPEAVIAVGVPCRPIGPIPSTSP